jgi:hypothetical protein
MRGKRPEFNVRKALTSAEKPRGESAWEWVDRAAE